MHPNLLASQFWTAVGKLAHSLGIQVGVYRTIEPTTS